MQFNKYRERERERDEGSGYTSWKIIFQVFFLQELVHGEPAELVRALVQMQDAQASFQVLRLFVVSRLSQLLRTVPPFITHQIAADYEALVEWALVPIIAGDGASAGGLPTPEQIAYDPTVCQTQTYLKTQGPAAGPPVQLVRRSRTYQQQLHQRRSLHRLPRLGPCRCCLRPGDLPSLLERLSERPMASALLK